MRFTLALGLSLLASYTWAQDDKPIPQDAAKMAALSREHLAWELRTLPEAYDRVGKKDPRWDESARTALDIYARKAAGQQEPAISDADVRGSLKKAVDAGCDDPMVGYVFAFTFPATKAEEAEYMKRFQAAAQALQKSEYPPVRRALALLTEVDFQLGIGGLGEEEKKEAGRRLDAVLDLLPKSMAEDPRGETWDSRWHGIIKSSIAIHNGLTGNRKAAFDRVDSKLAGIKGIEALRLTAKGGFLITWAWDARGSGYANTITEEGGRLFESRLDEARNTLEQAWELNPASTIVPTLMLSVETGNGGGDREAMETWFERAMQNNGNDLAACSSKLNWLDPKWYGDEDGEEMVAFGRACAATKNWQASLPMLVLDAHFRRFPRMNPDDWKGYLKTPEVWADFSTVYPEHLKRQPDDHLARSRYAMACYVSEHYQEADDQFNILGDNLTEWRSGPKYSLAVMKQCREEGAQFLAAQKKSADEKK